MKRYEAIYLPATDLPDPSQNGFNTYEDACAHIIEHLCSHCLKQKDPLGSQCAAEWWVEGYDSDE